MKRRSVDGDVDYDEDDEPAVAATPMTPSDLHRLGAKIWFDEIIIMKKGGVSSLIKSSAQKLRRIFLLPGRISWIRTDIEDRQFQIRAALDTDKIIPITEQLKESRSKKDVILEFSDTINGKVKAVKLTFQFQNELTAETFVNCLKEERTRQYINSANFTPKFGEELNSVIRAKISDGDEALKGLYLACCDENAPTTAVEGLFSNYLSLIDFEDPSPISFTNLLSAIAQDPVIYILFLCCTLEANRAMMDYFRSVNARNRTGIDIDTYGQLFDQLLQHIQNVVSRPEWVEKRQLFLTQFRYPSDTGVTFTSYAAFVWTIRFTNDYRKFQLDIHTLNHMFEDEKFLCFACLQHHADKGYKQIVQEAFPAVPQEYLFSSFEIVSAPASAAVSVASTGNSRGDSRGSRDGRRSALDRQSSMTGARPHFMDFLFHKNLKEKNLFLSLLQGFQRGQGYDNKFFTMFLNEAIQKDAPRIAVDVVTSILFLRNGDPSVQALKFCPKIPIILFEALLSGLVPSPSGAGTAGTTSASASVARRSPPLSSQPHRVSDDTRLLLEICLRFEYFIWRTDLSYIKTLSRSFRDFPEKRHKFMILQETCGFNNYFIDVCNHNLLGRSAAAAEADPSLSPSAPVAPSPATAAAVTAVIPGGGGGGGGASASMVGEGEEDDLGFGVDGLALAAELDDEQLSSSHSHRIATAATAASIRSSPTPAVTAAATAVGYGGSAAPNNYPSPSSLLVRSSTVSTRGLYASMSSDSGGAGGGGGVQVDNNPKYSRWLVRTESNLIAAVYGFMTMIVRCSPIISPTDGSQVVQNPILGRFLQSQHPPFYSVLLHPTTALRGRIMDFLFEQFGVVSLYQGLLEEPSMFSKSEHFSYSFLHALSYDAHYLTDLLTTIVTVAVRLEEYEGLYDTLHELDNELGHSQEKQQQLDVILGYVMGRSSEEIVAARLSLRDLMHLANNATESLNLARGDGEREYAAFERIHAILTQNPADQWRADFNALVGLPATAGPDPRISNAPAAGQPSQPPQHQQPQQQQQQVVNGTRRSNPRQSPPLQMPQQQVASANPPLRPLGNQNAIDAKNDKNESPAWFDFEASAAGTGRVGASATSATSSSAPVDGDGFPNNRQSRHQETAQQQSASAAGNGNVGGSNNGNRTATGTAVSTQPPLPPPVAASLGGSGTDTGNSNSPFAVAAMVVQGENTQDCVPTTASASSSRTGSNNNATTSTAAATSLPPMATTATIIKDEESTLMPSAPPPPPPPPVPTTSSSSSSSSSTAGNASINSNINSELSGVLAKRRSSRYAPDGQKMGERAAVVQEEDFDEEVSLEEEEEEDQQEDDATMLVA